VRNQQQIFFLLFFLYVLVTLSEPVYLFSVELGCIAVVVMRLPHGSALKLLSGASDRFAWYSVISVDIGRLLAIIC
jgi:hypothetical protein